MITRADIEERVREWGLAEEVVEKDYVLGWVLWGIGTEPALAESWVFKGGTCLKKCYLETYRFSEDLDFTVLPGGPILPEEVLAPLRRALARVQEESGIDFGRRDVLLKGHTSGSYTEGRIYYVGPRNTPGPASIRLDLSSSEVLARPAVRRAIAHPYGDLLPAAGGVSAYGPEEVFAEKLRALGERARPRDLFDVVNLYRRQELAVTAEQVRDVLHEKCQTKGVPLPTLQAILTDERRAELEAEWENMLAHQLPALPPLADFIAELPSVFKWLAGEAERTLLPAAPAFGEAEIATWRAPATISTWGTTVPLETIRFAAVNHLLVELDYKGSTRLIEPYSLRQSSEGKLILHAIRSEDREHRSYRVDRIRSVRITNRAFAPTYAIEFSAIGPLTAPSAFSSASLPRLAPPRASTRAPSRIRTTAYELQCPLCEKRFKRTSMTDTKLNKHKNTSGQRCPGSGRRGYYV